MIPNEYQPLLMVLVAVAVLAYKFVPQGKRVTAFAIVSGVYMFLYFKGSVLNEVTGLHGLN